MSVELGFETIGNATCTVFDEGKPILTTDPWIEDFPYFGSWKHRYHIPKQQKSNVYNSKYIWISHGHPDHLDLKSLNKFIDFKILVSEHYDNRIYNDLKKLNYPVKLLYSNQAVRLSKNISIKCFPDWNLDTVLIINIKGEDLIVNINDSNLHGIRSIIKKEISSYKNHKNKFLLQAIGLRDADMINFYDEDNNFLLDNILNNKFKTGLWWTSSMKDLGCNYGIPFSSMHSYQRKDSYHINKYIRPLNEHSHYFDNTIGELLPAFVIWDSLKKDYKTINPKKTKDIKINPEVFGDSWSDHLDESDKRLIENYFNQIETIKLFIGVIHFNCGGKIFSIKISNIQNEIFFEVPRNSLIKAIRYSIFDDLLIGNFMITRLKNLDSLYPNFSPYVTKYFDNGKVKDFPELKKYFKYYKNISGSQYLFMRDLYVQDLKGMYKDSIIELCAYYATRAVYHIFTKNKEEK